MAAVSDTAADAELLLYYQRRVAAFDTERQELLERVERCGPATPADIYKLQAENRKRTEEVRELQKALSDAHTYLFEERERLLALQAENDALRLQEVEDRARIKQLLAVTRPVEQRVVYATNSATNSRLASGHSVGGGENGPCINAVPPRTAAGRGRGGCAGSGSGSTGSASGPIAPPQRILHAVTLPGAQHEVLTLRVEALQAQLAEQQRFAAERIAALQEDRAIRERDSAAVAAALSATAEDLAQRLQAAEEALRRATKDYILTRQQRDTAEEAAAAARTEAAAERQACQQAVQEEKQRGAAQLQQLQQELEADGLATRRVLEEESAQRGEELLKFETLHKLIRGQLEVRVAEAERRAARLAARAREAQQRRAHEMEGWAADVALLRRRVAAVDRRLKQMSLEQRLPDDDRRDAALARHARRNRRSAHGMFPEDEFELVQECGVEGLAHELMHIKDSLLGMGQRVQRAQHGQRLQSMARDDMPASDEEQ